MPLGFVLEGRHDERQMGKRVGDVRTEIGGEFWLLMLCRLFVCESAEVVIVRCDEGR
jgi:hypothetical protein